MKQAVSHPVSRKAVRDGGCTKLKAFIEREPDKVINKRKERIVSGKVTSLVLTRKVQKFHSWERLKL